jgi:predicted transcriptional regulator
LEYQLIGVISQVEQEIIKIILKLKEKRQQFTFKSLLKVCKSKLEYSNDEIFFNLQKLYEKKVIVEDRQLVKARILDNANRKLLYQVIIENPGLQLSDLIKMTDIPLQTCCWHITILKQFKMIKSIQYKNRNCYGSENISDDHLKIYHMLRNDLNKRILKEIFQNSQISLSEISEKLKIALSTIHYHISELRNEGLIVTSGDDPSQLLKICPILKENPFFIESSLL